jgi:predicted O-methyltransferase YrrM
VKLSLSSRQLAVAGAVAVAGLVAAVLAAAGQWRPAAALAVLLLTTAVLGLVVIRAQQARLAGQFVTLQNRVTADTEKAKAAQQALRAALTTDGERTRSHLTASERRSARVAEETVSSVSALFALHGTLDTGSLPPAAGGWAARPETLLALVSEVLDRRPSLVVECGSGASTVWLALALKQLGGGTVVSLEHHEGFAEQTRAALRRCGLEDYAEVRSAPLTDVDVDGVTVPWYSPDALKGLDRVDLLFVDGPPAATGEHARFPAVPLIDVRLATGATVALDDANRPDEDEIVRRWTERGLSDGRTLERGRMVGRTLFLTVGAPADPQ